MNHRPDPRYEGHASAPPAPVVRRRAAGFTLVELLAVIAILGLLVGLSMTAVTKFRASGYMTGCQSNLRNIALTMQSYVDTRSNGKWHHERGAKFLLYVVKQDYVRGEEMKMFTCPATDDVTSLPGDDVIGSGLKEWEEIDFDCISYAGRDNVGPNSLKKDRLSEEVVASDDNWYGGAGRSNHDGVTNIVYGDGHIGTIETSKYKSELPEGQEWLPVGPESPDENLRKLAVD